MVSDFTDDFDGFLALTEAQYNAEILALSMQVSSWNMVKQERAIGLEIDLWHRWKGRYRLQG